MNEFLFYHIVNKHSEDARKRINVPQSSSIALTPTENEPRPLVSKPATRTVMKKHKQCVFHNICCFIATIMTAIGAFGMMALFTLVV